MSQALLRSVALSGLLVFPSWGALAEEDPVLATVNGEPVYQSELMRAVNELPAQYQANIAQVLPIMLERMVDLRLIGKAGRAEGLADDQKVQDLMEAAENQIISEVYLERQVAERVTDETVRGRYDEMAKTAAETKEVRARHILLENEEDARAVIADLDGGADFAELAKERSTGPSAEQGGDLGYFSAEQMVAPFSEAAFAMEPGSYSTDPVETRFGFHVIKVEDRRDKEAPTFESVEGQIREELSSQAVQDVLQGLRENAEIKLEPLDGVLETINSGG